MLDLILSWVVLVVPVILGVIVIAVPARHEDEKGHMRWRYALGVCLIFYGGLTWWQQSRERSASAKERQTAIHETSTKVSADVTKAVTEQYKQTVADQQKKIDLLQAKLDAQGRDVAVIKGSNIVTGKNPVKVEVTNEPSATTTLQVAREISRDTETILHNILLASRGASVTIHPASDNEATSFATRLSVIFRDAKWNVEWYPPYLKETSTIVSDGIVDLGIGIHCISNKQNEYAVRIVKQALERAEIQCLWLDLDATSFVPRPISINPTVPPPPPPPVRMLMIFVGKRPGIS